MGEVSSSEGRTVLFVSHNMGIIRNLCNKGILLDKGKVSFKGNMDETISAYEYENQNILSSWQNSKDLSKTEFFDLQNVTLLDEKGNSKREFFNNEKIIIKIDINLKEIHSKMLMHIIFTRNGEVAFSYPLFLASKNLLQPESKSVFIEIPANLLNEGVYFVSFENSLHCIQMLASYQNVLNFEIRFDKMEGMPSLEKIPGFVFPLLDWRIK